MFLGGTTSIAVEILQIALLSRYASTPLHDYTATALRAVKSPDKESAPDWRSRVKRVVIIGSLNPLNQIEKQLLSPTAVLYILAIFLYVGSFGTYLRDR